MCTFSSAIRCVPLEGGRGWKGLVSPGRRPHRLPTASAMCVCVNVCMPFYMRVNLLSPQSETGEGRKEKKKKE